MRFYRGRAMKHFVCNQRKETNDSTNTNNSSHGCFLAIIAWGIFWLFCVLVGKFTYFMVACSSHEHFYDFFETTTTCNYIGETTYRCSYEIDGFSCGKKKVVKDEDYAECDYVLIERITYTSEKETSLYGCKWCGKTIEKTKYHTYGKLGSNKIYDRTQYYDLNDNIFQAKFFNQTHPKPDELYAVLHFFDRNGNHIGYAYDVLLCSNHGEGSVWIRLKNNIPYDYYEHRWDLTYERPKGESWTFIRD